MQAGKHVGRLVALQAAPPSCIEDLAQPGNLPTTHAQKDSSTFTTHTSAWCVAGGTLLVRYKALSEQHCSQTAVCICLPPSTCT